jgi:hypothetical protein
VGRGAGRDFGWILSGPVWGGTGSFIFRQDFVEIGPLVSHQDQIFIRFPGFSWEFSGIDSFGIRSGEPGIGSFRSCRDVQWVGSFCLRPEVEGRAPPGTRTAIDCVNFRHSLPLSARGGDPERSLGCNKFQETLPVEFGFYPSRAVLQYLKWPRYIGEPGVTNAHYIGLCSTNWRHWRGGKWSEGKKIGILGAFVHTPRLFGKSREILEYQPIYWNHRDFRLFPVSDDWFPRDISWAANGYYPGEIFVEWWVTKRNLFSIDIMCYFQEMGDFMGFSFFGGTLFWLKLDLGWGENGNQGVNRGYF